MKEIIYSVACSLDGYTAGPKGDSSMFSRSGSMAKRYLGDLDEFDTVIMCRTIYELGYGYGLEPGQPSCAGKKHFIFSNSLTFPAPHPDVSIMVPSVENVVSLKDQEGGPICLCGGGFFAGWLLENGLIDRMRLRLNPIILGNGAPLFGDGPRPARMALLSTVRGDDGLQVVEYQVLK